MRTLCHPPGAALSERFLAVCGLRLLAACVAQKTAGVPNHCLVWGKEDWCPGSCVVVLCFRRRSLDWPVLSLSSVAFGPRFHLGHALQPEA